MIPLEQWHPALSPSPRPARTVALTHHGVVSSYQEVAGSNVVVPLPLHPSKRTSLLLNLGTNAKFLSFVFSNEDSVELSHPPPTHTRIKVDQITISIAAPTPSRDIYSVVQRELTPVTK